VGKGGKCPSQWTSPFFGLPQNYRKILHEDIFALIYHSNGFTHTDVYEMPVYLRRFYINSLVKEKESEKKAHEKAQKGQPTSQDPNQIISGVFPSKK
tara:strand:- start:637 stop:927 length:291 start_codon:yes stop_codon:yes gene_type:complete